MNTSDAPRTLRSSEPGPIVTAGANAAALAINMDPGSASRFARLGRETETQVHSK